jgi:hypothetical protein
VTANLGALRALLRPRANLRHHYQTSGGRVPSGRYFAGVDIASTDPEVDQMMLAREALPGSAPPPGTVITMNLHAGRLGVPWVDGVDWSSPPPSAAMRHLSREELSDVLSHTRLGRERKAAVEKIDRAGEQSTNDPP